MMLEMNTNNTQTHGIINQPGYLETVRLLRSKYPNKDVLPMAAVFCISKISDMVKFYDEYVKHLQKRQNMPFALAQWNAKSAILTAVDGYGISMVIDRTWKQVIAGKVPKSDMDVELWTRYDLCDFAKLLRGRSPAQPPGK